MRLINNQQINGFDGPVGRVCVAVDAEPRVPKLVRAESMHEFFGPLLAQVCGRKDQDTGGRLAPQELPDQGRSFNRLAETDFIRQEVALRYVLRDPAYNLELMTMQLHRTKQ